MDRKYTVEYIPEFADCDRKYDLKAQTLLAWCAELAGNHLRSRGINRFVQRTLCKIFHPIKLLFTVKKQIEDSFRRCSIIITL